MVRSKEYEPLHQARHAAPPTGHAELNSVIAAFEDFPMPSPYTGQTIMKHLCYYFGDENYPMDRHLQSLALDNPTSVSLIVRLQ